MSESCRPASFVSGSLRGFRKVGINGQAAAGGSKVRNASHCGPLVEVTETGRDFSRPTLSRYSSRRKADTRRASKAVVQWGAVVDRRPASSGPAWPCISGPCAGFEGASRPER